MNDCKKKVVYGVVGTLVVASVISVIAAMGLGIAAITVGGERTKKGDTKSYIYASLTAATGSALVSSILITFTVALVLRMIGSDRDNATNENRTTRETVFQNRTTITWTIEQDRAEKTTVTGVAPNSLVNDAVSQSVSSHTAEWNQFYHMRPLTIGGCVLLFIGMLFGQLAPLTALWTKGYAIQNANTDVTKIQYTSFIMVELLAGVVAPILFLVSGGVIAALIDYISFGRVDARELIPYILPSVKLFKTPEHNYWVIAETFYFRAKKTRLQRNLDSYHWYHTWDKSVVTWGLAAIIALAFIEAASIFANLSLDTSFTYDSCSHAEAAEIDLSTFSCYSPKEWMYVNCSLAVSNSSFHVRCLRFNPSVSLTDILQALVAALVVYNAVLQILQASFSTVKTLLRCRPTRLWGAIVVVTGVALFICGLLLMGSSFKYSLKYKHVYMILVSMIGICVIISGVLILVIKWEKKEGEEEEIELLCVYSDIPSKKIGNVKP